METRTPGVKANVVHSETKIFDLIGHLSRSPDLCILNPEKLNILKNLYEGETVPSKGYYFGGKPILIELKFIRWKNGPRKTDIEGIKKDLTKAIELNKKFINKIDPFHFFIFVFTRTKNNSSKVRDLFREYGNGIDNLTYKCFEGNFASPQKLTYEKK